LFKSKSLESDIPIPCAEYAVPVEPRPTGPVDAACVARSNNAVFETEFPFDEDRFP
jgi:hypothetical protein